MNKNVTLIVVTLIIAAGAVYCYKLHNDSVIAKLTLQNSRIQLQTEFINSNLNYELTKKPRSVINGFRRKELTA